MLFCAAGGRVFALDPATGDELWTNGLKGLGTGLVYLSTAQSSNTEEIMTLLAQQQADASASHQSSSSAAH